MNRDDSNKKFSTTTTLLLALALVVIAVASARADRRVEARAQFERAVKMRTSLEGRPQKDRSLAEYKQTVAAYHKVSLISTQVEEDTPSIIAEAELYEEMARQFEAQYFQSVVNTYQFLLKQYPGTRYRAAALFKIGEIQKDELRQPENAEATFKEFLKRFPHADQADDARQALKDIADAREQEADQESAAKGQVVEPRESKKSIPSVTDIRSWNAENYTRVVVTLDDTIQYDAMRISSPDRIYFDLYKARLTHALATKDFAVDNGLLKSVRVAQNKQGVVRIVLDVNGAKDYSAFLLSNPYRLVIDIRGQTTVATTPEAGAAATPAKKDAEKPAVAADETVAVSTLNETPQPKPERPSSKPTASAAVAKTKPDSARTVAAQPPPDPKPNRDGQISLTRTLGLKINRIVIDAGHGGHDTGTIGPHGLAEKDLCLDVALRLGRLIEEKLPGAEVVYTRKDDTFIPLEDRTAIANEAKADLFISIHANSSRDRSARGVETYYLNFATSADSMEVASRENALSQESLHDLQDLIKKIARNEKIEESKELATDIQDSLTQRLQLVSRSEKNRGVKKAPFIVLIGANMPSVLAEISFVSNPNDEKLLRKTDQRQRIADGLYRGIAAYLDSLNSLSYNRQKAAPGPRSDEGTVALAGNPK
jgi:N-acetylmuramoyl-L-alanine amidase